jgi:hypothetical protein
MHWGQPRVGSNPTTGTKPEQFVLVFCFSFYVTGHILGEYQAKVNVLRSTHGGIMRTYDEYQLILRLWEDGQNKSDIERLTGIPRGTVLDCIKRYGNLQGLERATEKIHEKRLLINLKNHSEFSVLHENYAYLLGLYLGDGHIVKMARVYRLRIFLDAKYPIIIQRCVQAIETLLPDNQVGLVEAYREDRLSHVDVSCYYKDWAEIFPQYGIGRKHNRNIALEAWQQIIVDTYPIEFLRGLYHSDGSRFSNVVNGKDYPRYQFTNISTDILKLFTDTCDKLNIHWTAKTRKPIAGVSTGDIYVSKRKNVEYLDTVVGPKA